ncbi:MAG: hypothetical protein ACRDBG_02615 [Waterburya sp.]
MKVDEVYNVVLDTIIVSSHKPLKKLKVHGTYCGHKILKGVDTAVHPLIQSALKDYQGPSCAITSMRRNFNPKSDHFHGRAFDLNFDEKIIDYLLSDEGKNYLEKHNLYFYIEGRPGSKRVSKYNDDPRAAPFVFFNPLARGNTGDHLHIGLK